MGASRISSPSVSSSVLGRSNSSWLSASCAPHICMLAYSRGRGSGGGGGAVEEVAGRGWRRRRAELARASRTLRHSSSTMSTSAALRCRWPTSRESDAIATHARAGRHATWPLHVARKSIGGARVPPIDSYVCSFRLYCMYVHLRANVMSSGATFKLPPRSRAATTPSAPVAYQSPPSSARLPC